MRNEKPIERPAARPDHTKRGSVACQFLFTLAPNRFIDDGGFGGRALPGILEFNFVQPVDGVFS